MEYRKIVSLALVFTVLPALAAAAHAQQAAERADGWRSISVKIQQRGAALASWTPERLRNAKPLDRPVDRAKLDEAVRAAGRPTGALKSVPPTAAPNLPQGSGPVLLGAVVEGRAPAVGKLFGRWPNGTEYECSAAVMPAKNKKTVLTAAHCLWDPDDQVAASDVIFVPGYRSGSLPYGGWEMADFIFHYEWRDNGKFHWDYAFIRLDQDPSRPFINDVVGSMGIMANAPNNVTVDIFGYPINYAGGEIQQRDHTGLLVIDFADDGPGGIFEGWFNRGESDFRGGSSGGPWVHEYDDNTRIGYTRGVTSIGTSTIQYSPYFDDTTWEGWKWAEER